MADEAGEDTPLLDEPPQPAAEPPVESIADAVKEALQDSREEEASPDTRNQPEAGDEPITDPNPQCKKKIGQTRALLGFAQILLTCCMPVVRPRTDSRDSSRRSSADEMSMPEKKASGKLGRLKQPDEEVKCAFAAVEDAIKTKVIELKGSEPESLEVTGYKEQHVVGINLFLQIKIDTGVDFIHAKIYQPIDGEPCLIDTTSLKIKSDEIEYF